MADVFGGFEAFGVKAVGVHLVAAVVVVALLNHPAQPMVVGVGLTEVLAEQVALLGG